MTITSELFGGLEGDVDFFPTKQEKVKDENLYGRCIYLLDTLQLTLPRWLEAKIPYSKELGSSKALWSPLLTASYKKGKAYGKGSIDELKEVLDALLCTELETFSERKDFHTFINSLTNGLFSTNVEKKISEVEGSDIEKFDSGFYPVDAAQGGFYQGLFAFAGEPGSGKSSILLNLSAQLAKQYPVWYFQTEIPSHLIESRISILEPEKWHKDSYFHAGSYSSSSILQKVIKNPDPNRVIVYDSPEIMDSGKSPIEYFLQCYQELVQIKLLSRMVIVTSQIKQNVSWNDLGIYSLNDSASKARYVDGIIYLRNFNGNLMCKLGKNRFGDTMGTSMVKYNYETMQVEDDAISDLFTG